MAWRAKRSSVRSGTSPPSATTITGKSERLTSCTIGSSASRGRSFLAMSVLALTSASARFASNPAWNSTSTQPPPSKAWLRISLMFEADFSCVSSGRRMSRSASSGEMPRCVTFT